MRIAVYGATGMIGSRIVAEAVSRGHQLTGVTRSGGQLPDGVEAVTGNAADADLTRRLARGHDVIVSALGPDLADADGFPAAVANLASTLGSARLLVVGGAGSLLVEGTRLVHSPDFPEAWRAGALITAAVLDDLRRLGDDVDWTYFSPAPMIAPGERTGHYTTELDVPAGESISAEDYAVAMLDEIEVPQFRRTRFTAAA